MNTVSRLTIAALAAALGTTASAQAAPKLGPPQGGFEVYSVDNKGGGWVIHKLPGKGDTLFGCADVANVSTCKQVFFNEWRAATSLSFLHVTRTTQDGWLKMSVPGAGDWLFACGNPEGDPKCELVPFELRMKPMPGLARVWPPYQCAQGCNGEGVPQDDPRYVIEDAANATLWVQLGLKVPGASNLYACRNLGKSPVCQLAVANWLVLDRQDIGIGKLEDIVADGADGTKVYGPGVRVGKVDEESVAYAAGIREGMVITKVGPFTVNDNGHARAMFSQYPAQHPFTVTLDNGQTLQLVAQRKPSGGKKK